MVEPGAGDWKTWVLTSPGEISVPPPPSGGAAKRDHDDVLHAVAHRNAAMMDSISFWDTGSPGYRWNQIAAHQASMDPSPDTFRVVAYVNLAIYDATIATWKAKKQCGRKRPSEVGPPVDTAVPTPSSPSYPSEHGAAAGAAVGVLSHLYPGIAADLEAKANEHGKSRVAAGVEHPTDFAASLALGKAVAAKLAARRIDVDGFGAPYPGDPKAPYPGGDQSFPVTAEEDFFGIMIGQWKTIAIGDPVAFRPPPPPAKGSPERAAELDEVRNYKRFEQPFAAELFFWAHDPFGRPEPDSVEFFSGASAAFHYALDVAFLVLDDLSPKILEYRLDANPPRAARAYAMAFAGLLDAAITCWNAKYHYLVGRPIHFDPTIKPMGAPEAASGPSTPATCCTNSSTAASP